MEGPRRFQAREEEARRLQATEHELRWSDAASELRDLRELGHFRLRTEGKRVRWFQAGMEGVGGSRLSWRKLGGSKLGWRELTAV